MKILLVVMLLAGCATVPPGRVIPPGVEVRTVEVPKIVPVPCIKAEEIPPPTPTAMPAPDADDVRLLAGAYVDLHNVVQENDDLRKLLTQCASGIPPAAVK